MTADPHHPATVSPARRIAGWLVHLYTASGLLIAAATLALLLAPDPSPERVRICFQLMLLAVVIDATDGTLARKVRIKEAVPGFDGRKLDDIVDFLMYTCLPLLLLQRTGAVTANGTWVLLFTLMASAYGFCQVRAKTDDGSFIGFPSYWNIFAYFAYRTALEPWFTEVSMLILALLTFVPSRYPYPTQPGVLNRWMLILSVPWTLFLLYDVIRPWPEQRGPWDVDLAAVYPLIYMGASWGGSLYRVIAGSSRT